MNNSIQTGDLKDKFISLVTHIKTESIKKEVLRYIKEEIPEYFYLIPASSSGKYHPPLSLGEGGLVRHTIFATHNLIDMVGLSYIKDKYTQLQIDEMIAAILLHDTLKGGRKDGVTTPSSTHKQHELLPVERLRLPGVNKLIITHMGEWGTVCPQDEREYLVHLADYLASKKRFIEVNLND